MLARFLIAALVIDVLVALFGPGDAWIRVGIAFGVQVAAIAAWLLWATRRRVDRSMVVDVEKQNDTLGVLARMARGLHDAEHGTSDRGLPCKACAGRAKTTYAVVQQVLGEASRKAVEAWQLLEDGFDDEQADRQLLAQRAQRHLAELAVLLGAEFPSEPVSGPR